MYMYAMEENRRYSKDLLQRFASNSCSDVRSETAEVNSDEVELSLGLSLGGCFGVDPNGKKMVRSSSIASLLPSPGGNELSAVSSSIVRTSSLPAEDEEMTRKREDMQSLKRLEAKRKRLERRNSVKSGLVKERRDEEIDGEQKSGCLRLLGGNRIGGSMNGLNPNGLCRSASTSVSTQVVDGLPPISQGSIGSQGSSSAVSTLELENRAAQGADTCGFVNCAKTKSPSIVQSLPGYANNRVPAVPPIAMNCTRGEKDPSTKIAERANNTGGVEKNMMEEMPCVSTKGEGPNGRKIEGFLHQFQKGKEVRIVCVCHGSFLTPAEFVKHAGGGDVAHPLRHIVVNPSPSVFL